MGSAGAPTWFPAQSPAEPAGGPATLKGGTSEPPAQSGCCRDEEAKCGRWSQTPPWPQAPSSKLLRIKCSTAAAGDHHPPLPLHHHHHGHHHPQHQHPHRAIVESHHKTLMFEGFLEAAIPSSCHLPPLGSPCDPHPHHAPPPPPPAVWNAAS